MHQVVPQRAGQLARLVIGVAERQRVVAIADADLAVRHQPILLGRQQKRVRVGVVVVLLEHPIAEIRVLVLDARQRHVQLGEQVWAILVDGIVVIRSAHPDDGDDLLLGARGVDGREPVDVAAQEHVQRLGLLDVERDDLDADLVLVRPLPEVALLDAVFVDADALAVEAREVVSADLPVRGGRVDVVGLRSHGQVGEEHGLGALRLVGHVAQQVDLAFFEHLQQVRPAVIHVLVGPAGIRGDLLLVLVVDPAAPPGLVEVAKRRVIPAHAHGLLVLGGLRGACEGQGHTYDQSQGQDDNGYPLQDVMRPYRFRHRLSAHDSFSHTNSLSIMRGFA